MAWSREFSLMVYSVSNVVEDRARKVEWGGNSAPARGRVILVV